MARELLCWGYMKRALATLLLIAGCACPGPIVTHATASRAQYAAQIDACLKMDSDCEALCRAVLALPTTDIIETCVVTTTSDTDVELDVDYVTPCGPD